MKKWIITGVALVALAGIVAAGFLLLPRLLGGAGGENMDAGQGALDMGGAPVEVQMGSVDSLMVLDATVRAEPGEDVEARNGGTVTRVWVTDGSLVDNGAPIVNVAVPDTTAGDGDGGEDGEGGGTREVSLHAPVEGRVSGLEDLRVGDVLEPGAVVANVAPDEFRAVASVPANDLYRFYEDPHDILLEITEGPPAAECEFLSLGAAEGGAGDGGDAADEGGEFPGEEFPGEVGGGTGGSGGSAELSCRVPSDLRVFEGVTGKMSIATGGAENVMVIPVTAVRGTSESGEVIVIASDGTEEVREVELGVSDGSSVEVVSGLSVGDQVLDPIPLDPRFDVPGAVVPGEELTEEEYMELEGGVVE
ncbi:HlyD family efflux transporter periplasmic adaptor subunit [Nocardiopsis aegyptia]|uniref:HlyD family efflux transporter periplasmic adaptor subunit n=1 Tax=Nocardiopsis aegyptia TaxID=220378 RepID=UPI003670A12A